MPRRAPASPWPLLLAALALALFTALLAWPGIAAYDATRQFAQAVTGQYDDWHPPVMARLWSLFVAAGAWGTAPMLLVQVGLYWAGLALLAAALARTGARLSAWAALLVGLSPPLFDWLPVVDKDMQLVAALVAATGLVAWFRLRGRGIAGWAIAVLAVLIAYALLLRANAVFAVVPLACAWCGWCGLRRWWSRAALMLAATLAVIGASGPVNHDLLRAGRSGVEDTLPIFDLAGITAHAHLAAMPGLSEADWDQARRARCYTPFYWDPFADPARCGAMGDALVDDSDGPPPLFRNWIAAIAAHPLAYAAHRLAHLNATLRLRAPADERSAAAPVRTSENLYGIGSTGSPVLAALGRAVAAIERTPAGSPAVWLAALCLFGWALSGAQPQPARDLGLSLVLSGTLMTASFAVVSIASDLRYHLWLIAATGITAVLLGACRGLPRTRLLAALAGIAAACVGSALLRAGAPPIGY